MKKIKILALAIMLGVGYVNANPVDVNVAKKVAGNFYAGKYASGLTPELSLVYTETDPNGVPVYYVFNVDANKGFVIIAAEDAAHPIIGYSDAGQFVIPTGTHNNVDFWLTQRKKVVMVNRANKITATPAVADEWASYSSGRSPKSHSITSTRDSCLPLVKTYWDQSPYYNAYCPGGSVTGCVATAMAQIMKYWAYPSVGLGSSNYNDSPPFFTDSWGMQYAYYDTSHYVWSAMPSSVGRPNNEVAKLMYDCGVSVDMDYTPSGSGASVMGGNPSAQFSYMNYFGYSNSINGAMYKDYSESAWISLLENELNNKRPMQFQGFTNTDEGHSWVCDGYSATNEFDMNWGWSGYDDGYYTVTDLYPVGEYDFTEKIGVLYNIKPNGPEAVQQITDNTTVSVYPNPSHGIFNFSVNDANCLVNIYNVLGQEVASSSITSNKGQINLSSQPKGIYIYRMLTEKGEPISTGRLIVE